MNKILPYLGRTWTPDFNCWDFIREFYSREYGIELEPHAVRVANAVRQADQAVSGESGRRETWQEVQEPVAGDVAVFGRKGFRYHVGLMINQSTVLHLPENCPSCAVPIRRIMTSFDNVSFYHHSDLLKPCQDSL